MKLRNKEIFPAHRSKRVPPQNIVEEDEELFIHEYEKYIQATSFVNLRNADILVDTVFSFSHFSFYPTYTHINGSFSSEDKIRRLKLFATKSITIENGIWITQNWTWMYFHWITDALTRLIALEDHVHKQPVLLPLSYKKLPFVIQSLDVLGYPYFFYSDTLRVRVKELVLPSHTASPGNYNKYYLSNLRQRFIKPNIIPFRKIFISRNQASQRFITNEEEVVALLLQNQFEVHVFENYPLSQQIGLMNEAMILLGLHGAGLTNMLFMPEKGNIVEIRNKGDKHNNCYFSMASELNHSYFYLQGLGDGKDTSAVNITIDLLALKNLLNLLN
jgi:capsular polysaccharide biosynthesis protein